MVGESCITFFWLEAYATARDAASICLSISISVNCLQDTENLVHFFALHLYYIISNIPAKVQ